MKRITILLSMLLFVSISFAETQQFSSFETIILHVRITDPTNGHEPYRLSPVRIPSVSIEGHSLLFTTSCDNCVLAIINEDGDTEYMATIPEGTTSLTLPSHLSGEYCIQIIRGRFCFWGYIDL